MKNENQLTYAMLDILGDNRLIRRFTGFNDLVINQTYIGNLPLTSTIYEKKNFEQSLRKEFDNAFENEPKAVTALLTILTAEKDVHDRFIYNFTMLEKSNTPSDSAHVLFHREKTDFEGKSSSIIQPLLSTVYSLTLLAPSIKNALIFQENEEEQFSYNESHLFYSILGDLNTETTNIYKSVLASMPLNVPEVIPVMPPPEVEKQTGYIKNKPSLTRFTGKDMVEPYITPYSKDELAEGKIERELEMATLADDTVLVSRVEATISRELDFFDGLIRDAYYTLRVENNVNTGTGGIAIPLLEVANKIHRREGGSRYRQKDKYIEDIKKRAEVLVGVGEIIDISQLVDYFANTLKIQKWIDYRDKGGRSRIATQFIPARVAPIELPNGQIVDALISDTPLESDPIYLYTQATNQRKTISGARGQSPLQGGCERDSLFYYLNSKVSAMPYKQDENYIDLKVVLNKEMEKIILDAKEKRDKVKDKYAKKRNNLFKSKAYKTATEAEKKDKEDDLKEKEAKELKPIDKKERDDLNELIKPLMEKEKWVDPWKCRIQVDNAIKTTKIKLRRSNIVSNIKTVLDYWVQQDFITGYTEEKERNKTVSFTVNFFPEVIEPQQ